LERRWQKLEALQECTTSGFSDELVQTVPPKILEILLARGFRDEPTIRSLLSPRLESLRDPSLLLNLDKAVERFVLALKNEDKICVYADFDLDGTSGAALLYEGLKGLGFKNVCTYQPRRLSQGYGVHRDSIEEIVSEGSKVLITVDVGTTAFEALERAKTLSLDVIVTDHHLPAESLPEAFAIVNPNQRDCTSGLKHLSGAGVGFYFLMGLKRALKEKGLLICNYDLKSLLDFFVIGTITDMVPLVEENRILTRHGLKLLSKTERPGLKLLLQRLGLWGRPLVSYDVAMTLAPKLNSLSRMDKDLLPLQVLLTETEAEAEQMIEVIFQTNDLRRTLQGQAEAKARILAQEQLNQWPEQGFIWVYDQEFHKGVVGLVATKLAKEFLLPAFVGHVGSDGRIQGSARLPEGSPVSLVEALTSVKDSLEKFGGHAQAAGFTVINGEAEAMREGLSKSMESQLSEDSALDTSFFDLECEVDELTPEFLQWYERLEPFGSKFTAPLICLRGATIESSKVLKGGHLKFSLTGRQQKIAGICFQSGDLEFKADTRVEALGHIQWNHYNGKTTPQFIAQKVRRMFW
jgi:single-stranded-DNA-specific exonuclease